MIKQRRLILTISAILLVLVVFLVSQQRNSSDEQSIRIGADITLTGTFGYFGQQLEKGLRLAESEANQDNSQLPVELLIRDNRHDAVEAAAIFESFANVDNVTAAISLYSPMSKTVNGKAEEYGIPLVTTYTTAKDITNDYTLRDFPGMDEQIPPLAEYAARTLGLKNVAAVIYQADFARDAKNDFESAFKAEGGAVISSDEIPIRNAIELVPDAIVKAAATNPDGIFIVLSAAPLGLAVKRLRDIGYEGEILSVIMFDSPEVIDVAGEAANGVVYVSIPIDISQNKEGRQFADSFRAAHGVEPDYMAVYGYTIAKYLIAAARDSQGDRQGTLEKLRTLDTASIRGQISTQDNGDIQSPIQLFRFENGKGKAVVTE